VSSPNPPAEPVAVVTGSTGFIGRHVVRALVRSGWRVRLLVRRPFASDHAAIETIQTPLVEAAVLDACREAAVLIHVAGRVTAPSQAAFDATNVEATRQVAGAAARARVHLVHVSSQTVAGPGTIDDPRQEDEEPRPITAYARSKAEGERIVRSTPGMSWTIVRPTIVYGPGDRAFAPVFRLARLGIIPTVQSIDAAYMLVHVSELAEAIVTAATAGRGIGQTCFIAHPRPVPLGELLGVIGGLVGRQPAIAPLPRFLISPLASAGTLAARLGLPHPLDRSRFAELCAPGWVCRVNRARDVLGFEARIDVTEGFRRSSDWYVRGEESAMW
jgi:UDP-glucose 4-epimerase